MCTQLNNFYKQMLISRYLDCFLDIEVRSKQIIVSSAHFLTNMF